MPDPFATLRSPVVPTRPDPVFEARLRARLEDALTLPEGVDVTITTLEAPAPTAAAVTPVPPMALTPYLAVADGRRAIEWYVDAFGARLRGEPIVMPDGRIGHAELDFGGALVMLADEFPDIGHTAPRPGAGSPVTLHLEMAGIDDIVARAVEEGATLDRPPADHEYGRNATIIDPFGHRWLLAEATPTRPEPTRGRHGDVGHVSMLVPDLDRAQAFYGAVLGWTFVAADRPIARRVSDSVPRITLYGGHDRGKLHLAWQVDDVDAAVETVRDLGGAATDPVEMPYGSRSDCTDDQGMAFTLWQPPAGAAPATRPPDLAYLVLNVVDSSRFRRFFGELLGWTFSPGRVEDGWNIEGTTPTAGFAGGAERPSAVPMYRVGDVEAAVDRVRAAGGTATDVERMPYGLTSDCTDDQGMPFYLGQL